MNFKPYNSSDLEVALQRMTEQKKKKVLFTSHVANFQKFNRPYMRMLSDKGYEVHYASMGEEEIHDCDKSFVVPFSRSPFNPSNIKAYRQLKKIIDKENYDIIHTHTPVGGVVTRLAAIGARRKGTRLIYTAHGFHFYKGAPTLNWIVYYPIERYMARHTDTLITINKEDYELAKNHFEINVQYVPGVGISASILDNELISSEKIRLRNQLKLTENDFTLLYAAELNKNKNQKLLIDAMEQLVAKYPDIHLLLPGKDSLRGFHQRYISKKKLDKNIHLLGYRTDIPSLLKISNVSVSASQREGLPVNIMEAMYLGIPVVATDCRGNRDLVKHNKTGYIVPVNSVPMLHNSIKKIYNNEIIRNRFSLESRARSQKYLLSNIIVKMNNIYEDSSE